MPANGRAESKDPCIPVRHYDRLRVLSFSAAACGCPNVSRFLRYVWDPNRPDECALDIIHNRVWQRRFYDFNVWTGRKRIDQLRCMHRNPVKRGLVMEPDQWTWSSLRAYMYGEPGLVRITSWDILEKKIDFSRVSA